MNPDYSFRNDLDLPPDTNPTEAMYLSKSEKKIIDNPESLWEIMQKIYRRELSINPPRIDYYWVLALNKEYRLFDLALMPKRDIDAGKLKISQVFKFALYMDASWVVVVHTDPSEKWELTPYQDKLLQRIKAAAVANEMPLTEYMVISKDNYYSFRKEGKL